MHAMVCAEVCWLQSTRKGFQVKWFPKNKQVWPHLSLTLQEAGEVVWEKHLQQTPGLCQGAKVALMSVAIDRLEHLECWAVYTGHLPFETRLNETIQKTAAKRVRGLGRDMNSS